MVVGICRIELSLPGNDSLKGKRSVLRRIVDRTRQRFNVAVAEVDDMDAHERAVLGLAVVSNDARHANAMLDTIFKFVEGVGGAQVVGRTMEIVSGGTATDADDGDVTGHWSDYEDSDGA